MPLVDLKNAAKNHRPKIKYYYVKSRKELIEILTLKDFPQALVQEKLRTKDLRQMAKDRNIPNIWRLRRSQLMDLLYPGAQEDDKNDDGAEKHDDPEEREGKEVGV